MKQLKEAYIILECVQKYYKEEKVEIMSNQIKKETMMENLAKEIYTWCKDKGLWGDNIIYFNDKAWSSSKSWSGVAGKEIGDMLYEYENRNPLNYFEYANPDTLSMSFEGSLYEVLNYGPDFLECEFVEIFDKYGYYFELGNAWNLSAYEV